MEPGPRPVRATYIETVLMLGCAVLRGYSIGALRRPPKGLTDRTDAVVKTEEAEAS